MDETELDDKKANWTVKISPRNRERLKALTGGREGDIFVTAMLDALETVETPSELCAPNLVGPRREVPVITNALQTALEAMVAAICLAEVEAGQAQVEADRATDEAGEEVARLTANLTAAKADTKFALEQAKGLKEDVDRFTLQAESLDALKAAWGVRETEMVAQVAGLHAQVATLDAEAAQGRELGGQLQQLQHEHGLQAQDLTALRTSTTTLLDSHEKLTASYSARVDELAAGREAVVQLTAQLDANQTALDKEAATRVALSTSLDQVREAKGVVQADLAATTAQLVATQATLEQVQAKHDVMSSDLERIREARNTAQEELASTTAKLAASQDALARETAANQTALSKEAATIQALTGNLEKMRADLEKANAAHQSALSAAQKESIVREQAARQDERDQAAARIAQLEAKLDEAKRAPAQTPAEKPTEG